MTVAARPDAFPLAPPALTGVEVLLRAAEATHLGGDRRRALELYEQVLHGLPRSASSTAATTLRLIGRVHWEEARLDAAIEIFHVALFTATAADDPAGAAACQNMIAVCHWQRGELDEAEWLFRATRATAHGARDGSLVATVDMNLGIIESIRGNLHSALRHYQTSLAGYRALGARAQLGRLLSNMGMTYAALERWEDAERAYDEAESICEQVGDLIARAMVQVNRVQLWIARGDIARAHAGCDAILGGPAATDARVRGETLKLRGIVAREEGDHAGADGFLASALESAREREEPLLEAETLREIAEVAARLGRNREMLRALSQAHHIFARLRARRDLADVGQRAQRLEQQFHEFVARWSASIESKDPYTQGHCERVSTYACALAERAGLQAITMFWFRVGALLHDVGKIVVPTQILTKPGPLTDEERRIMERHAQAGAELLSDVDFPWDVLPIIRNHHERWDGCGYPDRLAGEAIPLAARVLCIADVYDALTTDRPYRKAFSPAKAIEIMSSDRGAFDATLFGAFREMIETGTFVGADERT
ncbi:MAG TPA: HD domain-containing phosphohydrolase [Gemmatimonadaceae bacterium]|nr:HD domain-containing phosphohydrolase [Gemmatimonadaceae bacterium]